MVAWDERGRERVGDNSVFSCHLTMLAALSYASCHIMCPLSIHASVSQPFFLYIIPGLLLHGVRI